MTKLSIVTIPLTAVAALIFGGAKAEPTFAQTAFVPVASPTTSTSKSSPDQQAQLFFQRFSAVHIVQAVVPTASRNIHSVRGISPLFAKKKKNDTAAGKTNKIQVKLTKHIAGTGQAGDVIMVAPAFFTNKLQKTGSAVRISDEEVAQGNQKKADGEKQALDAANDLKNKFSSFTMTLSKKTGPNGHLFGAINYKAIMTELKKDNAFPKGALDAKWIKISGILTDEGENNTGAAVDPKHGIKEVGDYVATIALLKGVSADFKLLVKSD
mmetsp:Transcript_30259/g.46301  ORF Transcript_30259/g.46301 Transcript_30259/m.46301 type:complete len:268 (-) Transcript_30259:23-826(-)